MNAPQNSRTFKSGNSEAVRLPKGLGFGIGKDVVIERRGAEVILRARHDPAEEQAKLRRMVAMLDQIGPVGEIEKRVPVEFPDRPGLY